VGKAPVDAELLVVPDCPNSWAAQELLCSRLRAGGLPGTPVRVSVLDSLRAAEQRGLVGSPTILINGVDPFAAPGRPAALARIYPGPPDWPSG
jgi:hypothetical protein